MEFIELSKDRYLVVGSQNIILNKKEMLEAKRKNILDKDLSSNGCQKETIQERQKIEKELKEYDKNETIGETKQTKARHTK